MATLTLPGADIRGYYHQLGIHLPEHTRVEASLRCFADPGAHRREDRHPSCSVNVINGAWQCHACGARGGAYDAALAKGYTPRAAIDLMIAYGLIERRTQLRTARELLHGPHGSPGPHPYIPGPAPLATRPALHVTEHDIARWHAALSRCPSLVARLARERGWRHPTMRALGLGLDRGRITIPIRNAHGQLRGVLRYQPEHTRQAKMLAAPGTRLGLVPHPSSEASKRILLVEGPPDMIVARSRGLPAIAVPGDHAWRPAWAELVAGRKVTIVMDADTQGRSGALRIVQDLAGRADAETVDLDPGRDDGYDLTEWLVDHPEVVNIDGLRSRTPPDQRSRQQ